MNNDDNLHEEKSRNPSKEHYERTLQSNARKSSKAERSWA
jgi:hypothetical protein